MIAFIFFKKKDLLMKISFGGISVGAGASVIFLFSLKRWFMRRFCNIGIIFITRKA